MSNIESVSQPRIDVLVTAADGSARPLRRTEYRGTVWFGGRPQLAAWGAAARGGAIGTISTPFWVPDSLAYRSDAAPSAVLSASAALQSAQTNAQLVEVNATLHPHPGRPGSSFVLVTLHAVATVPLGISYTVVVLADPAAVLQ